jgi:hypothetical protein
LTSRFRFSRQNRIGSGSHIEHMQNQWVPGGISIRTRFRPDVGQCSFQRCGCHFGSSG